MVEMAQSDVSRFKHLLQFESWLRNSLRHLPPEDHDEYVQRGQDLLLQYLCQAKLQLALDEGLRQETTLLSHDELSEELQQALRQDGDALKENLFAELDIPPVGEEQAP